MPSMANGSSPGDVCLQLSSGLHRRGRCWLTSDRQAPPLVHRLDVAQAARCALRNDRPRIASTSTTGRGVAAGRLIRSIVESSSAITSLQYLSERVRLRGRIWNSTQPAVFLAVPRQDDISANRASAVLAIRSAARYLGPPPFAAASKLRLVLPGYRSRYRRLVRMTPRYAWRLCERRPRAGVEHSGDRLVSAAARPARLGRVASLPRKKHGDRSTHQESSVVC